MGQSAIDGLVMGPADVTITFPCHVASRVALVFKSAITLGRMQRQQGLKRHDDRQIFVTSSTSGASVKYFWI